MSITAAIDEKNELRRRDQRQVADLKVTFTSTGDRANNMNTNNALQVAMNKGLGRPDNAHIRKVIALECVYGKGGVDEIIRPMQFLWNPAAQAGVLVANRYGVAHAAGTYTGGEQLDGCTFYLRVKLGGSQ